MKFTSLACALALGVLSSDLGLGNVGSSLMVNADAPEPVHVDVSPLVSYFFVIERLIAFIGVVTAL